MNNNNSTINTVQLLVQKAKEAQKQIEKYNQEQVDEIVTAIAWALCNPTTNKLISNLAVETTGLGNAEDKINKNRRKTLGLLRDLKGTKTVGIINEDEKKGIIEIAKPVGVVGAVTPSTNPAATPINNILNAVKGRNAIIISPSPAGQNVFKELLLHINKELDKIKAPKNLIQTFETEITKDLTNELMKHVDLVVVTGSQNNVREAAKSGTPAIGVGQGNVTVIVDESANLKDAANKIKMSKIFDNATSCSSENNIILIKKIYDEFINLMKSEGGFLLNSSEKKVLEKALWIKGKLNRNLIAKPAIKIANEIKLSLNSKDSIKFLMVEEKGIGKQHLFSGEKLSPVLTVYKADDFNHAKTIANEILNYQGIGHSIGIHSNKNERVMELGLELPVCRVIVNQAHAFATGGSFNNGLPFSLSMGCGTWQKNSIDDNLNYKHFINVTKISTIIKGNEPKLRDFFEDYCKKYHKEKINNLD
jgi:sulfoacetaldehyde dehydrogenase